MTPGVTICIPSIPQRAVMLSQALVSVVCQTRPVAGICVAVDHEQARLEAGEWGRQVASAMTIEGHCGEWWDAWTSVLSGVVNTPCAV